MMQRTPRVAVLGPVKVAAADGIPLDIPGATSRALLASLALGGGASRSVDAIAADVWGDDLPANPRGAVQTLVSRLRSLAGADIIRSDAIGYALGVAVDSDLAIARDADAAAARLPEGDAARLPLLEHALSLWRGEAGADLAHSPVALDLAAAVSALHDRLRAARSRSLIVLGRAADAIPALAALADSKPYDEEAHAQLMTALVEAGREQEALAVFARLRTRLRDDLGSSPSKDTSALNARILRGDEATAPARVRIGLQAAPNELIGRDDDVERIEALLATSRLVTILGPGGLGKTRLAQAVAAASDAPVVAVVALAGIRADADLEPAIGAALGISESSAGSRLSDARSQPDLRTRIVALLGERPALLVLDNCEQIIDAAAAWAADMLGAVPTLRIVTTSRTPVAIAAEAVYPLTALSAGDGEGPAVRLFLERARAARPDARLDGATVARLCDRLDGLPLAIELAAARVRTMTAEQIESRLENRFALLTSGDRAAPERHRTLQAVIEWSWDLLDDDARNALVRLSLLPAGFSTVSASAVLGESAVDDLLDRLVSQSLLAATDTGTGVRFRMLETVREFGLARLAASGAEDDAWHAVLAWAGGFSRMPGAALFGECAPVRPDVLAELNAENDNLVAALRYAAESGLSADVVRIFSALMSAWVVRGAFTEFFGFTPIVIAALDGLDHDAVSADLLVSVLLPCGLMALVGEDPRGLGAISRLRRIARTPGVILSPALAALLSVTVQVSRPERMMAVLRALREEPEPAARLVGEFLTSQTAENTGDTVTAASSAQRAWELAGEIDDRWIGTLAASAAAQVAGQSGHHADSLVWLDRARRSAEGFDVSEEQVQQDWTRGIALLGLGRLDEAESVFEDVSRTAELTQQGVEYAALGWFGLAEVARTRRDLEGAVAGYRRSLAGFPSGDQRATPWYLVLLATLITASVADELLPAADLARWANRLRTRTLALHRMNPTYVDRPVIGTALAGWSSWALTTPTEQDRGLRGLALAELLGARQDLPSLSLTALFAQARGVVGAEAVAAARAAASALPSEQLVDETLRVLTHRVPGR
ncbi:putative ATPase/DNA-binding SARP family transcriptional activator [Microbacterium natoriense]|uniref:ATPase/DNA-binding SARP family transcriptional activator n=2 Tax=Microbacterium natoriense TaxID=284570 RepID=A0AAW8F0K4_9MICO|nr:putative ATPase/DNA-binding SARP family transcriptional activator [Microbacterium natoriense]